MTQPLYRRLHQIHPNCQIDVFAPKWSMAVFERMPEIRHVLENPFGHGALQLRERWRVGRELGQRGYDQVIVLPNSLKSAIVAAATGAKQRTGYVGEMRYILLNDLHKLDKQKLPLMVDRYTALACDFAGQSSQPRLHIDSGSLNATLQKYALQRDKKIMALCAGAEYGSAKRWLPEHFAATAQHYAAQGWQIWLFGSHKDFEISEEINRLSGSLCVNLCGKTSLAEAIDLLSCADGVVCNDSGLMHLSAAVGAKLVAVYGSSSPHHTPPLSDTAHIASLNLACSPCFKRECPLGHTDCLRQLQPETVIALHQKMGN
ncbi:heptosyltransferase-2 [Alysiella filiformis DSM 16848]|uniref:lipopolysaccharide heptosyltransferase II n=2 Tax=Alysiella TaxID=194195 RepID=A0A286ECC3_9NEIS|nr:heptosyltransferase-2 [Alysiella filiformis DSM 16848]